MDPEAREAALAEVLAEVLADADAAACTPATLYQDFTVRCRIRRLARRHDGPARVQAAGSPSPGPRPGARSPTTPGWERAQAIAAGLPDDLAGLFLLVARAAIEGAPCPTDAMLAERLRHQFGRPRPADAGLSRGARRDRHPEGPARRADHRGAGSRRSRRARASRRCCRGAEAARRVEKPGGTGFERGGAPPEGSARRGCEGFAQALRRAVSSLASSTAARSSISAMSPSRL